MIDYSLPIPLLGIYPEGGGRWGGGKKHDSKTYTHPSVHCRTIHNTQDMDVP